jgi:hypothetical protein
LVGAIPFERTKKNAPIQEAFRNNWKMIRTSVRSQWLS